MFRHCLFVLTGVVISAALAGCKADISSGTRLSLGDVSHDEALAVAREVMRKHFELAAGNPGDIEIVALPKPVDARAQRILGGKSPTRQLATLRIQPQSGNVVANATVLLQRQGSASFEQFGASGNYSTIPNETPSQRAAATTPEQNEAWETRGRDKLLERTIVQELYDALHPPKTP
ncbi:MAG: hypothetical protein QGH60_20030 [Phycisphaerae bacterium]|jgi:hypothetical protein|nr:hypothetical protein [Phycisphaerae bacterium]